MKKFAFRLQRVMELKEDIERKRMLELAEARMRVEEQKERLMRLQQEDLDCRKKLEMRKRETRVRPGEIESYHRYLNKLKSDMFQQDRVLQERKRDMAKKRHSLLEAAKDRKILEKLKEKQLAAYMEETAHQERIFLDDIAAVQTARGRLQ